VEGSDYVSTINPLFTNPPCVKFPRKECTVMLPKVDSDNLWELSTVILIIARNKLFFIKEILG
jgi:hypothetical protein